MLLKPRWIAQLIVASGSVVARAFTQALRNEMQGECGITIDSIISENNVLSMIFRIISLIPDRVPDYNREL